MLLNLVGNVTHFKNCFVVVGPHYGGLQNLKLKVGIAVPEEAHLETICIVFLDIGKRYVNKTVARVVVRVNQVQDYIHLARGAAI